MKKQLNPTVAMLLEAYLKQDNVKIEFKQAEVFSNFQEPDYLGTMLIKENDNVVLQIELDEYDLRLLKHPFFKDCHFRPCRHRDKSLRFLYVPC